MLLFQKRIISLKIYAIVNIIMLKLLSRRYSKYTNVYLASLKNAIITCDIKDTHKYIDELKGDNSWNDYNAYNSHLFAESNRKSISIKNTEFFATSSFYTALLGEVVLLGLGFPFTYSIIPVIGGLAAGKIITHIEF